MRLGKSVNKDPWPRASVGCAELREDQPTGRTHIPHILGEQEEKAGRLGNSWVIQNIESCSEDLGLA